MADANQWAAEANFFSGMDGLPFMVSTINEAGTDTETVAFTTSQERANLIAAAPELLGGCESAPVLSAYHGARGFDTERFVRDYETWAAKKRAAIAKAVAKPEPGVAPEELDPDWVPY